MNIVIKEFTFISNEANNIEGVLFYDADVIDENTASKLIHTYGYEMDNRILKKDAPCFFLPKAQADMLHSWVQQKLNNTVTETWKYVDKSEIL